MDVKSAFIHGYIHEYIYMNHPKVYSQVQCIYYNETFSPVENMDSIRLALSIATSRKWEVHHMDVKYSFLHGDLKEEIYMQKLEVLFF